MAKVIDLMASDNELIHRLEHGNRVLDLAISPDQTILATASADTQVRLWDVKTSQRLGESLPHPREVNKLAFSPNGRFLITACHDQYLRVWDVNLRELVSEPIPHTSQITAIAADNHHAFTGTRDGLLQRWDLASSEPASVRLHTRRFISSIAVNADGSQLFTGAMGGQGRLWAMPNATDLLTEADLALAESICGRHLDGNGVLRAIPRVGKIAMKADHPWIDWIARETADRSIHPDTPLTLTVYRKRLGQAEDGVSLREVFRQGSRDPALVTRLRQLPTPPMQPRRRPRP